MPCYQANPKLTAEVSGPCTLYFASSPPGTLPDWAYFFAPGAVSNTEVLDPNPTRFTGKATLKADVTLTDAPSTGLGLRIDSEKILFRVWVKPADLDPKGITPCDISPWA